MEQTNMQTVDEDVRIAMAKTKVNRSAWTKRALLEVEEVGQGYRIRLYGPEDGSGCVPIGQRKEWESKQFSNLSEALRMAIAFADSEQIVIREWNLGTSY